MKPESATAARPMPGPWKVGYRGTAVFATGAKGGDQKVCDIRGWGYLTGNGAGALGLPAAEAVEIQLANARLIAAAPLMLQALEAFDADLSRTWRSPDSIEARDGMCKNRRAAWAAARVAIEATRIAAVIGEPVPAQSEA